MVFKFRPRIDLYTGPTTNRSKSREIWRTFVPPFVPNVVVPGDSVEDTGRRRDEHKALTRQTDSLGTSSLKDLDDLG